MVQSALSEKMRRVGSKSGDEDKKSSEPKMCRRGIIMSWSRRMPTPESLLHFQR